MGDPRSIESEIELMLVNLKKELPKLSLPLILKAAKQRKLLPPDVKASSQSIYRIFQHHGLQR